MLIKYSPNSPKIYHLTYVFWYSVSLAEVKNRDEIADALFSHQSSKINTVDSRAPHNLWGKTVYVNAVDARGRTPLIVSIEYGMLFRNSNNALFAMQVRSTNRFRIHHNKCQTYVSNETFEIHLLFLLSVALLVIIFDMQ